MNKTLDVLLRDFVFAGMVWLLSGFVFSCPVWAQPAAYDAQVEALLARMTLEEKAGQMTQLTLQAVARQREWADTRLELDPEKLREAIVTYGVGSMLNTWDAALTLDRWREVIRTIQDLATKETRLGIPVLYGIDAVHGNNYLKEATIFPHQLAMAATWDPELVREGAHVTAVETRASGVPWNFAPVLDVGRQPLWSRFFETFGEDPYLVSRMGVAAVEGMQGDDLSAPDRVAATLKHYVGYSFPFTGKDRTPAYIPERLLREIFLPPFRKAIAAGAASIMINSGEVNGVPVHVSHYLLTDVLRDELGFEGVAVTDWEDVKKLVGLHRVAATEKEAVRMAVMAGVDMSMTPYTTDFAEYVVELVREGAIPEARVDEAVRRILRMKMALGLFENAYPDTSLASRVGSEEHQAVSLKAAREAITLLENDGVLPLAKDARILLTGPGADWLPPLYGAWSYTWQGTETGVYPPSARTFLQALRAHAGEDRVTYVPGTDLYAEVDIPAAVAAAADADAVVVALAEKPSVEGPGSIEDLDLPAVQTRLVRALAATGKPVILVMLFNRPRVVRPAAEVADAVLMAYHPGPFGGQAIAEILYGDVNPSGRLPFTYPRYANSLLTYDHKNSERQDTLFGMNGFSPQWEFGHGLSYTTFAYRDLSLSADTVGTTDTLRVSVTVANTGDRAGQEVVQLYSRDLYASITPSVKRLRRFEKIALAPGEARTVTFTLPVSDLAFIGLDNRPVVEPGGFEMMVGDLTASFVVE